MSATHDTPMLLAIDTATEACSAALLAHGSVSECYELAPRRHAGLILSMVDSLLQQAGVTLSALDALAFGRGPGAFTGLRIAAGVAQGLAFAAGLPLIPVSTLAALALQGPEQARHRLCALDARMGEVYWCAFVLDADGLPQALGREQVSSPQAVGVADGATYYGLGSGWASYADTLRASLGPACEGYDGDCYPRARDMLRLARADYLAGRTRPPESAAPVYLRDRVTN